MRERPALRQRVSPHCRSEVRSIVSLRVVITDEGYRKTIIAFDAHCLNRSASGAGFRAEHLDEPTHAPNTRISTVRVNYAAVADDVVYHYQRARVRQL